MPKNRRIKTKNRRTIRAQKERDRRLRNLRKQRKCKCCKGKFEGKPKQSMQPKIKTATILLGAGAAIPWGGPVSSSLDELIRKDTTFNTKTDCIPIGEFIFKKLESYYNLGNSVNFETFLGALEYLVDFKFSETNQGKSPLNSSFIPLFSDLCKWIDELYDYRTEEIGNNRVNLFIPASSTMPIDSIDEDKELIERIFLFELVSYYYNIVAGRIAEYSLNVTDSKYNTQNRALLKFVSFLKHKNYSVNIFTTNYDRLVPMVIRKHMHVFDGFNDFDTGDYGESYLHNSQRILRTKKSLNYFNLHGSIFWKREYTGTSLGYKFLCTPNETHSKIEPYSSEPTNPGHAILPINIVTGYNKVQRVSLEPLNLFYNSFFNRCSSANLLVTIGYSFSDFHINRVLNSALLSSPECQHLHIGYNDNPINYKQSAEFKAIDDLHAVTPYRIKIRETDKNWSYSSNKSKERVIYYNGFESFLKNAEWKNII